MGQCYKGKSENDDDNMRNVDNGDCEEGDDEEGAGMNVGHIRKMLNAEKTLMVTNGERQNGEDDLVTAIMTVGVMIF